MAKTALNLSTLAKHFSDETAARELLERMRWPDGRPVCPTCGQPDHVYRMRRMAVTKKGKPGRPGLLRCRACKRQFTVTVGTIFEDSHIPLSKWLLAIYLLCGAGKKGVSAHQLHRMLDIKYQSAWFMAHRLRYAMAQEPLASKLRGIVEVDETFVGGRRRGSPGRPPAGDRQKTPVVALVERNGRARAFPVEQLNGATLRRAIAENIEFNGSTLMTDESNLYSGYQAGIMPHHTVNHSRGEYARGLAHTNTVEGFFSLLKRGLVGTYHRVSKEHLHRYCDEFSFRYSHRELTDGDRAMLAVLGAEGKRLTYRQPARTGEDPA
jgi:transposase-like protein